MRNVINTKLGKIGSIGDKYRVWLEGMLLANNGVQIGEKYRYEPDDEKKQIRIVFSEDGQFRVSRRNKNGYEVPIIDASQRAIQPYLSKYFKGVEGLRVRVMANEIVIMAAPLEAKILKREEALKSTLEEGKPLSLMSLCSGGQILDNAVIAGLKRAGIESKLSAVVEMESKYLDSGLDAQRHHYADNALVLNSRLEDVEMADLADVEAHGLVVGLPCEGASDAQTSKTMKGKPSEAHPHVGGLGYYMLEIIRTVNPAFVLLEQVGGFANSATMYITRFVLERLGYKIESRELSGNAFGALENRKRFTFVALSRGLAGIDLTSIEPVRSKEENFASVKEDVPDDSDEWIKADYLARKEESDRESGKGFRKMLVSDDDESLPLAKKGYAKIRSCEPYVPHPDKTKADHLRRYTRNEHCSVKTIPRDIISDKVSMTIFHEIAGQSVIHAAFDALGRHVGRHLQSFGAILDESICEDSGQLSLVF
ncbi:DNA cytosine methyltransferase [Vibrio mediterranei]|uniref:DNA cytosine methyltransferase n=1 Tax=Vibrio mediterranei TaxID=689 RepID=UPI0040681488